MQQNAAVNPGFQGNTSPGVTTQQQPAFSRPTEQQRVDSFGLESQARVVSRGDDGEELLDNIVDIDTYRPNMFEITLESGQIWRQMVPKRFALRKGDPVRIYPIRIGEDYRLTTARLEGFIQVKRVK